MDKQLVQWLNSTPRDYKVGVDIYGRLGKDAEVLKYLMIGKTQMSETKLFEELRKVYYDKKSSIPSAKKNQIALQDRPQVWVPHSNKQETQSAPGVVHNPELETVCKLEADKHFKELMNVRAQLFALCPIEQDDHENDEMNVRHRELYALEILKLQPHHHEAYEKLRYVQQHGKLPEVEKADPEVEPLPNNPIDLYKMRINLMKGLAKLRKKEATPKRTTLIQQQEEKLKSVQYVIDLLNK